MNTGLKMNLNLNAEAKLFVVYAVFTTTTGGWKEPFLQFKCSFLQQFLAPKQGRMAVCQLVHEIPDPGHWVEQSSCLLVSRTRDIRFGLHWLEKGKFMYWIFHLHHVTSTLHLKEMGCFWECELYLPKPPISLETNVWVFCPPSIQLKKIKSCIRCTPCIIQFLCIFSA